MADESAKLPSPTVQMLELGELDHNLGFHIRSAHGAVYRHFTDTFSDVDLTQKQVAVLILVDHNPGVAQIDIGHRLYMDRATTMAIIDRLQSRGYLRREQSKVDRRRQALFLTTAGKGALVEARAAVNAHENWLKGRFTAAELEALLGMLRRILG